MKYSEAITASEQRNFVRWSSGYLTKILDGRDRLSRIVELGKMPTYPDMRLLVDSSGLYSSASGKQEAESIPCSEERMAQLVVLFDLDHEYLGGLAKRL